MVWSFVYLVVTRMIGLVLLCFGSGDAKEVEILVLRHELEILRRQHAEQLPGRRDRVVAARPTVTNPVVSVIVGTTVFHEAIAVSGVIIAALAASLAVMLTGVVLLASSPALVTIHQRRLPDLE